MESQLELREDIKQILLYQRETNGKVATAYEKLATLEERTQTMRDGPSRIISYTSIAIAIITFLISIIKASPAVAK